MQAKRQSVFCAQQYNTFTPLSFICRWGMRIEKVFLKGHSNPSGSKVACAWVHTECTSQTTRVKGNILPPPSMQRAESKTTHLVKNLLLSLIIKIRSAKLFFFNVCMYSASVSYKIGEKTTLEERKRNRVSANESPCRLRITQRIEDQYDWHIVKSCLEHNHIINPDRFQFQEHKSRAPAFL